MHLDTAQLLCKPLDLRLLSLLRSIQCLHQVCKDVNINLDSCLVLCCRKLTGSVLCTRCRIQTPLLQSEICTKTVFYYTVLTCQTVMEEFTSLQTAQGSCYFLLRALSDFLGLLQGILTGRSKFVCAKDFRLERSWW